MSLFELLYPSNRRELFDLVDKALRKEQQIIREERRNMPFIQYVTKCNQKQDYRKMLKQCFTPRHNFQNIYHLLSIIVKKQFRVKRQKCLESISFFHVPSILQHEITQFLWPKHFILVWNDEPESQFFQNLVTFYETILNETQLEEVNTIMKETKKSNRTKLDCIGSFLRHGNIVDAILELYD